MKRHLIIVSLILTPLLSCTEEEERTRNPEKTGSKQLSRSERLLEHFSVDSTGKLVVRPTLEPRFDQSEMYWSTSIYFGSDSSYTKYNNLFNPLRYMLLDSLRIKGLKRLNNLK